MQEVPGEDTLWELWELFKGIYRHILAHHLSTRVESERVNETGSVVLLCPLPPSSPPALVGAHPSQRGSKLSSQ